jgi:putative endonuclease
MYSAEHAMGWFVYVIEASDGSLYTGVTTDVERRFSEHCGNGKGANKGAKFFRGRRPLKIVYTESHPDRGSAQRRESTIKKLTRDEKLRLTR